MSAFDRPSTETINSITQAGQGTFFWGGGPTGDLDHAHCMQTHIHPMKYENGIQTRQPVTRIRRNIYKKLDYKQPSTRKPKIQETS